MIIWNVACGILWLFSRIFVGSDGPRFPALFDVFNDSVFNALVSTVTWYGWRCVQPWASNRYLHALGEVIGSGIFDFGTVCVRLLPSSYCLRPLRIVPEAADTVGLVGVFFVLWEVYQLLSAWTKPGESGFGRRTASALIRGVASFVLGPILLYFGTQLVAQYPEATILVVAVLHQLHTKTQEREIVVQPGQISSYKDNLTGALVKTRKPAQTYIANFTVWQYWFGPSRPRSTDETDDESGDSVAPARRSDDRGNRTRRQATRVEVVEDSRLDFPPSVWDRIKACFTGGNTERNPVVRRMNAGTVVRKFECKLNKAESCEKGIKLPLAKAGKDIYLDGKAIKKLDGNYQNYQGKHTAFPIQAALKSIGVVYWRFAGDDGCEEQWHFLEHCAMAPRGLWSPLHGFEKLDLNLHSDYDIMFLKWPVEDRCPPSISEEEMRDCITRMPWQFVDKYNPSSHKLIYSDWIIDDAKSNVGNWPPIKLEAPRPEDTEVYLVGYNNSGGLTFTVTSCNKIGGVLRHYADTFDGYSGQLVISKRGTCIGMHAAGAPAPNGNTALCVTENNLPFLREGKIPKKPDSIDIDVMTQDEDSKESADPSQVAVIPKMKKSELPPLDAIMDGNVVKFEAKGKNKEGGKGYEKLSIRRGKFTASVPQKQRSKKGIRNANAFIKLIKYREGGYDLSDLKRALARLNFEGDINDAGANALYEQLKGELGADYSAAIFRIADNTDWVDREGNEIWAYGFETEDREFGMDDEYWREGQEDNDRREDAEDIARQHENEDMRDVALGRHVLESKNVPAKKNKKESKDKSKVVLEKDKTPSEPHKATEHEKQIVELMKRIEKLEGKKAESKNSKSPKSEGKKTASTSQQQSRKN